MGRSLMLVLALRFRGYGPGQGAPMPSMPHQHFSGSALTITTGYRVRLCGKQSGLSPQSYHRLQSERVVSQFVTTR